MLEADADLDIRNIGGWKAGKGLLIEEIGIDLEAGGVTWGLRRAMQRVASCVEQIFGDEQFSCFAEQGLFFMGEDNYLSSSNLWGRVREAGL